jgi:hypothetical protein
LATSTGVTGVGDATRTRTYALGDGFGVAVLKVKEDERKELVEGGKHGEWCVEPVEQVVADDSCLLLHQPASHKCSQCQATALLSLVRVRAESHV